MLRRASSTFDQSAFNIFWGRHLFTASTRPTKLRRRNEKGLATVRTLNLTAGVGSIHRQAFSAIAFEIYGRHETPLILANDISLSRTHFTHTSHHPPVDHANDLSHPLTGGAYFRASGENNCTSAIAITKDTCGLLGLGDIFIFNCRIFYPIS